MATVKIKLRESQVRGKAGCLYYQICHRNKIQQISTRMKLRGHEWDAGNERVILSGEGGDDVYLASCQRRLERDVALFRKVIYWLDARGKKYTVRDVVERFRVFGTQVSLFGYVREQIHLLEQENRMGTARNYKSALNSLMVFMSGVDVPLMLFDSRMAAEYENWLRKRGVVRNTASFYMRILRSVYNKAVKYGLVEPSDPFRFVYTGVDRTRKRAVGEDTLTRLQKLDLAGSYTLSLARDLFVFSYCMRGMSFIDMVYLRKCDLVGDTIHYVRRKTGRCLQVKVEACMRNIIERYAGYARDSVYLFPVLRSENPRQSYSQYRTALGLYNQRLKKISALAGIQVHLSSYTSRHTWATAARNHQIPLSVISAGMGHASEKTTLIYLAALENSEIDKANRQLLSFLNG